MREYRLEIVSNRMEKSTVCIGRESIEEVYEAATKYMKEVGGGFADIWEVCNSGFDKYIASVGSIDDDLPEEEEW